jgi:hypothetical protein
MSKNKTQGQNGLATYVIIITTPEEGNEHEPPPGKVELWGVLNGRSIVQQHMISIIIGGWAVRIISTK